MFALNRPPQAASTPGSHALRLGWLVGWSLWLLPAWAGATTVLEVSFATLVKEAEVIAVGTVTAIEPEWDARTETPLTLVTFSDLAVLKGAVDQPSLTLEFVGGPEPDGTILEIVGTPAFRVGERSVVFSAGNGHQVVPLVGVWQGVYRVVFDAARGIETIHDHAGQPVSTLPTSEGRFLHAHGDPAPASGAVAGQQGRAAGVLSRAAAQHEAMPLSTFTRMIEREVGEHP